ncbi:MAG: ChrB protein [Subtercola sp.]|nr:ChrB protein [Subtercola sp.]
MPTDEPEDETEKIDPFVWLVLVYRIPSEPSRLRSTVWRRLKALGAVYLQNSVAALPDTPGAGRALRKLRHDILQMSGSAILMSSTVLVGETNVLATFQEARTDEYEEIVDRCGGFLAEIEKEYAKSHFTYAELEENEVDYTKLVNWLEKVRARDTFNAPGRAEAEAAVQKCEQVLEEYASRVYAEEPEGH